MITIDMELPEGYLNKIRPRARKIGEPRNQREELIERFRVKLNEEQVGDGRKLYSYARLAQRFDGLSDSYLFQLYTQCGDPSVKRFGAMLTYKLRGVKR